MAAAHACQGLIVDSGVWSAAAGDAAEIARLARLGESVNVGDMGSFGTPLQIAVAHGHLEAARTLINLGADVNCRQRYMETPDATPLELAKDQPEMVALLRRAGAR
jgi:hypothetical protein